MPIKIESDATDTISLTEFLDHIEHEVEISDIDQLAATSDKLKALCNNRSFLGEFITRQLENAARMQLKNSYNSQVLILGGGDNWFARANFWPAAKDSIVNSTGRETFYYDVPHDHNFNFLTIGYYGPGYESDFYEYDHSKVQGYVGEKVELRPIGRIGIPQGHMLLYRRSLDVHSQLYPDSFSITLNLVHTDQVEISQINQYYFDVKNSTIGAIINRNAAPFLISAARHLGLEGADQIFSELISPRYPARIRAEAMYALFERQPGERERLIALAADDTSDYLSNIVHQDFVYRATT
ncbi:transposase [Xanthomonas hyacinthi]|uniref:Uncharacterized protein n=1 Tax=Xanthomonas hyacinthi TaxID=56455 RepID=A0A2S7F1S4_9XANT|nr:hypothetical protein [Xanthomonas hyacinthi]PPU99302.1 hypothetical protein XhyaCFBP1156_03260 [Xanthomonas hyacinthi]QGY78290.1 transposase [Xanthomonas hyacinthi]